MKLKAIQMQQAFQAHFNSNEQPLLVASPGRVNIIGEHTDYNDGFVLPAAIDKAAYVAISKRNDDKVLLFAKAFDQQYETTLNELLKSDKGWPNYILGIVDQLLKQGKHVTGFNLMVDGDVPLGAGLSSSAALECACVFALNELYGLQLSRLNMALAAQKAEHEFAAVNCGIMDMFASLFGKSEHAILLDCRDYSYKYVPLALHDYKILLLNTNVKHNLASSEYNIRRAESEQVVAWVAAHVLGVTKLRDVSLEMLQQYVQPQSALIYKRCKYVVDENQRLQQAAAYLQYGQLQQLGALMFEAHEGLSKDYGVSCKELDFLVDAVKTHPDVLGARMMGGGFGGCTINLVKASSIDALVETLQPTYEAMMGLPLTFYIASVGEGTHLMTA